MAQALEYVSELSLRESITVDYDLTRILAEPTWEQRASFLSAVLGNQQYDVTIDLGAGLGEVSAWAAQHSRYVIGFDLSQTHCLLYNFVMWQRRICNAYIFRGTLDILGGVYCPAPVDLIVCYNGLTRPALLEQCCRIGRYLNSHGWFLLVCPTLFFGVDDTSPESIALRNYGLTQGWEGQELSTPLNMRLESASEAGKEKDSLPFLVKMSNLPALFDFERGKPVNTWMGNTQFELRLEYRLYKKIE